jgi:ferredoxin-NADP reductase/ferredoxin
MVTVKYGEQRFEAAPGKSVLDVLLAHGVETPSGCRSGICQSCVLRAVSGKIPEAAQRGLTTSQQAKGYFLACSCIPEEDLEVAPPDALDIRVQAGIQSVAPLGGDVFSVQLKLNQPYEYSPGQFLRLYSPDGISRCYSIASVPTLDSTLNLQVRHIPGGQLSSWLCQGDVVGQTIEVSESMGSCHYQASYGQQPMLLMGTGSGLAPLYGILRDALAQNHEAPIRLYHGALQRDGLYLVNELQEIARQHPNFTYIPCVLNDPEASWARQGDLMDTAFGECKDLTGWQVFFCGNPDMVKKGQREAFLSGASMGSIHADPFLAN